MLSTFKVISHEPTTQRIDTLSVATLFRKAKHSLRERCHNWVSDLLRRLTLTNDDAIHIGTPATVRARDLMCRNVLSVLPDTSVQEVAELMLANLVTSVPVINADGRLVGVVNDHGLLRRAEIGTQQRYSILQMMLKDARASAIDYVRSRGRKARDVMTTKFVTVAPHESLDKVAEAMARSGLGLLPVIYRNRVIGVIRSTDIVRRLAEAMRPVAVSDGVSDQIIWRRIDARIRSLPWSKRIRLATVTVEDGVATIYGWIISEEERRMLQVLLENTPGIRALVDRLQSSIVDLN
jgi:CBS domain-containing protein